MDIKELNGIWFGLSIQRGHECVSFNLLTRNMKWTWDNTCWTNLCNQRKGISRLTERKLTGQTSVLECSRQQGQEWDRWAMNRRNQAPESVDVNCYSNVKTDSQRCSLLRECNEHWLPESSIDEEVLPPCLGATKPHPALWNWGRKHWLRKCTGKARFL